MRIPFFRIFYSTTFTVLSLITGVLLLITPADLIYQSIRGSSIYNIFIVAGVYLLIFAVAVLLYASRIYTNRRNLIGIPKRWSPVEKEHVENRVRVLVAEKLQESARIAYLSYPRDFNKDSEEQKPSAVATSAAAKPQAPPDNVQTVRPSQPPTTAREYERPIPPWGIVNHPGWAPPDSPDLPNLQYEPVVKELGHLIEAKAVSLAPPDPLYDHNSVPTTTKSDPDHPYGPPLPDALAVEILQRHPAMGMREYLVHLTSLNLLHPSDLADKFLPLYEKARFSGEPATEAQFRALMGVFAEILRGLRPLDMEFVAQLHADNVSLSEESSFSAAEEKSNGDNGNKSVASSTRTVNHRPQRPDVFYTPRPSYQYPVSVSSSNSRSTGSGKTVHTAPSRHASRASRARSPQFLMKMQSRSSLPLSLKSQSSASGSNGSVIRLAEAKTHLDLPYTIVLPSQQDSQ
ncbi:MAG: hypothetical protein Q9167_004655 [Letrouitia subvulpina]